MYIVISIEPIMNMTCFSIVQTITRYELQNEQASTIKCSLLPSHPDGAEHRRDNIREQKSTDVDKADKSEGMVAVWCACYNLEYVHHLCSLFCWLKFLPGLAHRDIIFLLA